MQWRAAAVVPHVHVSALPRNEPTHGVHARMRRRPVQSAVAEQLLTGPFGAIRKQRRVLGEAALERRHIAGFSRLHPSAHLELVRVLLGRLLALGADRGSGLGSARAERADAASARPGCGAADATAAAPTSAAAVAATSAAAVAAGHARRVRLLVAALFLKGPALYKRLEAPIPQGRLDLLELTLRNVAARLRLQRGLIRGQCSIEIVEP